MTVWEKFIFDILNNYKKEDLICQYYTKLYGGNKGTKCSKLCPFRQFGGNCALYNENGNRRVSRKEIEKILSSEVVDMNNLRCSDCKYKEDFSPSGCEKCNTCEWGLGVSDLHTNFEPIERSEVN